jgi:hypothetical protein
MKPTNKDRVETTTKPTDKTADGSLETKDVSINSTNTTKPKTKPGIKRIKDKIAKKANGL